MTSSSPAWQDINPAPPPRQPSAADCRAAATRIRNLTDFAVQMVHEGQLTRALNYLADAHDVVEELRESRS